MLISNDDWIAQPVVHRALNFFRAKFYAAEIASAIGYLHSLQIIYR
jgi:serine/threonine protein kinase